MSRMQFVYSHHPENPERIRKYQESFETYDDPELINYYNKQAQLGFVGVRAQGLAMIALYWVFEARFGESPIEIIDNCILRFKGVIATTGDGFYFTEIFYYENQS